MTKEELARKKGIKLNKEVSPSDSLVINKEEKKPAAGKSTKKSSAVASKSKKPAVAKTPEKKASVTEKPKEIKPEATVDVKENKEPVPVITQPVIEKRGPGKPRKRKAGDKKLSFWLDEDLVKGLYATLSYGESAGDKINDAIRFFQQEHKLYQP